MKIYIKHFVYLLLLAGVFFLCPSCKKNASEVLMSNPGLTLTSFSPASALPSTQVTITGAKFGTYKGAVHVYFGGIAATQIDSVSDNTIIATVPAKAASGLVSVSVWNASSSSATAFTVLAPPSISSVSTGAGVPGDTIVIYGSGFGSDAGKLSLSFNGVPGTILSLNSTGTAISVKVPDAFTSGALTLTVNGYAVTGPNFGYLKAVPTPVYQLDFEGNLKATIGGDANYIKGNAGDISYIQGVSGQAVNFPGYLVADNGVHQAVALPTNAGQYNELTVSCWVYHPADLSKTYFEPVWDFGTSNNTLRNNNLVLCASTASWWNNAGNNVVARYIYDVSGTYNETNSIASQTIPQKDWHHLVVTVSKTNSTMVTYMDGVQIGSASLPSYFDMNIAAQDYTFIGAHADHSNNYNYAGGVDKFQIWNAVLDANQVYTLYYKK